MWSPKFCNMRGSGGTDFFKSYFYYLKLESFILTLPACISARWGTDRVQDNLDTETLTIKVNCTIVNYELGPVLRDLSSHGSGAGAYSEGWWLNRNDTDTGPGSWSSGSRYWLAEHIIKPFLLSESPYPCLPLRDCIRVKLFSHLRTWGIPKNTKLEVNSYHFSWSFGVKMFKTTNTNLEYPKAWKNLIIYVHHSNIQSTVAFWTKTKILRRVVEDAKLKDMILGNSWGSFHL